MNKLTGILWDVAICVAIWVLGAPWWAAIAIFVGLRLLAVLIGLLMLLTALFEMSVKQLIGHELDLEEQDQIKQELSGEEEELSDEEEQKGTHYRYKPPFDPPVS